jgi:hypothetical protein
MSPLWEIVVALIILGSGRCRSKVNQMGQGGTQPRKNIFLKYDQSIDSCWW